MKQNIFIYLFFIFFIGFWSCNEGLDASLFNNVNELEITGKNSGNYEFNHLSTDMVIYFHNNLSFDGIPEKRLSMKFTDIDENNKTISVNEKTTSFFDAMSPGDYYAYSFIDFNQNSKLDSGEPYDIWQNSQGYPKMIQVREESRWELLFVFNKTYSSGLF